MVQYKIQIISNCTKPPTWRARVDDIVLTRDIDEYISLLIV